MEVIVNQRTERESAELAKSYDSNGTQANKRGDPSSSFDCDSSTIDVILGLSTNGCSKLRLDMPESRLPDPHLMESCRRPPCHTVDADFKRERLLRLLDRQQAWYDAAHQAALAAERLLSLCEHHQQQWLQPIQQSPRPHPFNER